MLFFLACLYVMQWVVVIMFLFLEGDEVYDNKAHFLKHLLIPGYAIYRKFMNL